MKKAKHIITLVFILIFNLLLSSMVFAAPQNPEDTSSVYMTVLLNSEITDMNQIYDRARNGITARVLPIISAKISNTDNEIIEVPTYSTTQLLKVEKNINGSTKETFVTSFFTDVNLDYIEDQDREKWDSSYSVMAFSTVYYSIVSSGGIDYYDITTVSGGWYRDDTSVALSDREVVVANQGGKLGGGISTTIWYQYPTSNTFSYETPSSWPLVASSYYQSVGMTTKVKLTRGGSTWHLTLSNILPPTM